MGRRFDTLDGLRGVAALAVVIQHGRDAHTLKALLPLAYLAVDFFFALSGFVLSHAYGERIRAGLGPLSFLRLRLIRLWPLYIFGTIGTALLAWRGPEVMLLAAAFLPVLTSGQLYPLNPPAWSLLCELVSNVVFATIGRWLNNVVLGLVLLVFGAGLAAVYLIKGHLLDGALVEEVGVGLLRVGFAFFAGVAVHRLWQKRPAPRLPTMIFPVLLIGMLMLKPAALVWALLGFPVLIWLAASAQPSGPILRVCQVLGLASYGVYVLQWPVLLGMRKAGIYFGDTMTVVAAVGLVALSYVLTRVYDEPFRAWLLRLRFPARRQSTQ